VLRAKVADRSKGTIDRSARQILLDGRDAQWDSKIVMALLGFLSRQAISDKPDAQEKNEIELPQALSDASMPST
jgi:hypothetical protein